MKTLEILVYVLLLAVLTQLILYSLAGTGNGQAQNILGNVEAPRNLDQATEEFIRDYGDPKIVKVTEGVHVAIGFAMANTIILEGPSGLVIVDATESYGSALLIHQAIRNMTDKKIRAIVVTHHHADHTLGSSAYRHEEDYHIPILAHSSLKGQRDIQLISGRKNQLGSYKQFGAALPDYIRRNGGMGLALIWPYMNVGQTPDVFLEGRVEHRKIAGLQLEFYHLPGETDDHIVVWLPEKKVLCSGDNIYKNFPNSYTIRGSTERNLLSWAKSLETMQDFGAEYMVPSHTDPVHGHEKIQEVLTIYRDAIMFVHDQSVRYMNQDYHPEEIARLVKLPDHIASHPYLRQHYGTVEWSSKAVYSRYQGWFSGDPVDLSPLTHGEEAERMVKWLGERAIIDQAKKALRQGDYQWALKLATFVYKTKKKNTESLVIRTKAMKGLASQQTSINGRNYYLSSILLDHKQHKTEEFVQPRSFIRDGPMSEILMLFKFVVRGEDPEVNKAHTKAAFVFPDTQLTCCMELRNGVLDIVMNCTVVRDDLDLVITVSEMVWKEIIIKERSPFLAYLAGDLIIEGGLFKFKKFVGIFQTY